MQARRSASISLVVLLVGCIWRAGVDNSPTLNISPRGPVELAIIALFGLCAIIHLGLVIKFIAHAGRGGEPTEKTSDPSCLNDDYNEGQLSDGNRLGILCGRPWD